MTLNVTCLKVSVWLYATLAIGFLACKPEVPIITDGILGKKEWEKAEVHQQNISTAYIMRQGDLLNIALITEVPFWAHVYLYDGNVVRVYHASAAIGAVNYTDAANIWSTKNTFEYHVRDTVFVNKTMSDHFNDYGWVANNINMGNGKTIEFKIDVSNLEVLYLASVISDYEVALTPFPPTLSDDTINPKLVQGYAIDSLLFEPMNWMKIK